MPVDIDVNARAVRRCVTDVDSRSAAGSDDRERKPLVGINPTDVITGSIVDDGAEIDPVVSIDPSVVPGSGVLVGSLIDSVAVGDALVAHIVIGAVDAA